MLSRLESLDITSNKILIKMVGLKDGLKNLKFYDNPSYRDANKLCEYIVKNLEHALSPNIDVLYYPEMYKAINSFNGDKQEIFDLLASHGKWTEKLTEERKTDFDASEHDIPNEHTISYRTSDVNLIHQKILC